MKTEPKFKPGDIVEADTIFGKFKIVHHWWEDKTYGCKNGSWVYRLGFMTKSGAIDQRKNYRQFEENRLTETTDQTVQ